MAESVVIVCSGPDKQTCFDAHPMRWHCMRGHDGAAVGSCPLKKCERAGANRTSDDFGKDAGHG